MSFQPKSTSAKLVSGMTMMAATALLSTVADAQPVRPPAAPAATPPWAAANPSGAEVRIALAPPDDARLAHLSWNKVVRTPQGAIVLACVAGEFHGNHGGGCPAVARSTDGGQTFSQLRILREFGRGRDYTCCGNLALGRSFTTMDSHAAPARSG